LEKLNNWINFCSKDYNSAFLKLFKWLPKIVQINSTNQIGPAVQVFASPIKNNSQQQQMVK